MSSEKKVRVTVEACGEVRDMAAELGVDADI